jgi:hypothetical protein
VGSGAAERFGTKWRHLDAANHVAQFDAKTLAGALASTGFASISIATIGMREYSRWPALHVPYDAVMFGVRTRVHPTRHELVRAVARKGP